MARCWRKAEALCGHCDHAALAAALGLAGGLGMRPAFEAARMWRGAFPRESHERSLGVATPELG